MFRLTGAHRYKVSNQLAVLAAFLLVAASIGQIADSGQQTGPAMAQTDPAPTSQTAGASKNKGFKVSLYLFRRN